jgi:hypothetical protein
MTTKEALERAFSAAFAQVSRECAMIKFYHVDPEEVRENELDAKALVLLKRMIEEG